MIKELTKQQWNKIIEKFQVENFFYDSNWLDLTARCFGLTNHFVEVEVKQNKYFLILQTKAATGYCPFIGYTTLLSRQKNTSLETVQRILEDLEHHYSMTVLRTKLHPKQEFVVDKSLFTTERNASIPIPADIKKHMQLVHKNTRTSVRYALKHGITIQPLKTNHLHSFYEMHTETMKRVKSTYQTPLELFEGLLAMKNVLMWGAFKDNSLIAASVFFVQGRGMYYWWNCSNAEGKKYCGNYLLIYEAICHAQSINCTYLDMSSSHTPQVELPKLRWGAIIEPFYTLKK